MATNKNTGVELSGNNFLIVFVLISLLVVGVTGLAAKFLITSIVRDGKVVSAKSLAVKQLNDNLTNAPQLVDAYQALGKQATVLSDALPTTPDFPSLIVALESMGNSAGVTLKSVAPAEGMIASTNTMPVTSSASAATAGVGTAGADMPPTPQPYQFVVNFSGSYAGLQKFLGEVELSARPMRVVGIEITGTGASMSGEISIQTYYQALAQWPFGTETIK